MEQSGVVRRDPVVHELKCWSGFFEEMWLGRKCFDVRRNDRGYQRGDVLHQREFVADNDPAIERDHLGPNRLTKTLLDGTKVGGTYTGREIRQRVTYVMRGPQLGLEAGWVAMSLEEVARVG